MKLLITTLKFLLSIASIELCYAGEHSITVREEMLKYYIEQRLELPPEIVISRIKLMSNFDSLKINNITNLNFECHECLTPGLKNVQIKYKNELSNLTDTYWIQISVEKKIVAIKSKVDIPGGIAGLERQFFETAELQTEHPEQYVTDLKTLHFYKSNKSLPKGSFLKLNDIIAQNLIIPGKPIHVVIEGNGLQLRFPATSRERGIIGQSISVKNEKNGKSLVGEVLDFNLVRVRL